jgi:hypothetical protein
MIAINAGAHSEHIEVIRCDFKLDQSGDLFIIIYCEAFKHEIHLFIINVISVLIEV